MELFVAALLAAVPFVYGASVVRRVRTANSSDANHAALGLPPRKTAWPVEPPGSLIDPSDLRMPAWLCRRLEGREGRR